MSCQRITAENCQALISTVDTILIDCDGSIWNGNTAITGVVSTIAMLKKMNKKVIYVTNNSKRSTKSYMMKFHELGFEVTEDEIFSPSLCVATYLAEQNFKETAYVIGSQGIIDELDNVGIKHLEIGPDPMKTDDLSKWLTSDLKIEDDVGAVILGYDPYVSFPKYTKACSYLKMRPDCHFIQTNEEFGIALSSKVFLPVTGSIVSPVAKATGRTPVVLGKPHQYIFEAIDKVHNVDPKRTMMIGDTLISDILFGANNNFVATVLVLSGVSQLPDVEKCKLSEDPEDKKLIPTHYADSVADFGKFLQQ